MPLKFLKGSVLPALNSVNSQDRCCAGKQRKAFFKLSYKAPEHCFGRVQTFPLCYLR